MIGQLSNERLLGSIGIESRDKTFWINLGENMFREQ